MEVKVAKSIQSIDRAVQILKCFEGTEELGVTEISKMTGLHKSTAFGLIYTLEANGLLEKNEDTGKYRLGIELFRMGSQVNFNLRRMAVPSLERLVKQFQETVNLVVRDGDSIVYLEKVESTHSMRISTTVGGHLPLYCTAAGKAILAHLSRDKQNELIDKMEFVQFTEQTVSNREELLQSLEEISGRGYAEDLEELQTGLTCVSAPIYNYLGTAFAAVSVSGPTSRMNEALRREIASALIEVAKEISHKMGYRGEK